MSKLLNRLVLAAVFSLLFPASLMAQSSSKSFTVSVTIPERLELSVPSHLRMPASTEGLLLRTNDFQIGRGTNLGKNVDACTLTREDGGRRLRVFTLTAL